MAYNNNNSVMVKNINGTSKDRYVIENLHKKFIDAGGTSRQYCQVKGCDDLGRATAHVLLCDGRRSNDWFTCWVCARHNNPHFTDPYPLRKNARLVSVRELTGN
jgi:hypothetical protein